MGLKDSWFELAGRSPDGKKFYAKGEPPVPGKRISGWSGSEIEMSRSSFYRATRTEITRPGKFGQKERLKIVRQDAAHVWLEGMVPGINGVFEHNGSGTLTKIPRSALRLITGEK